jgi:undecaprenyl-diphosphatase
MSIFEAIVIAIVEGITEFLPVSSTGHMIITSAFLGIEKDDFTKLFEIAVQLGAILAVVVLYWKRFFRFDRPDFYFKLLVGVIPALLLGYFFNDAIEKMLERPSIVAASLLLGGIVLLYIDKWFHQRPAPKSSDILATETTKAELIEADEKLSYKKALVIGCWQVLAMIPGVSRSAASIIGGMQQKLSRNFAAEFSFFLAVPTMFAASAYSLFLKSWGDKDTGKKGYELLMENNANITAFVIGNVVAFIVAMLAIKFFITFLKRYGFRVFGIYRIIAGIVLLALIFAGYMKA